MRGKNLRLLLIEPTGKFLGVSQRLLALLLCDPCGRLTLPRSLRFDLHLLLFDALFDLPVDVVEHSQVEDHQTNCSSDNEASRTVAAPRKRRSGSEEQSKRYEQRVHGDLTR